MSLDHVFDRFRTKQYNCWSFANDVWFELTGSKLKMGNALSLSAAHSLRRINAPVSPCIVLMQHPLIEKHVGIFFEGKLLHLAARGVEYMPIEIVTRSFSQVRYYQ